MKIVVLHGSYGCDTGCCGHWVEVDGERVGVFEFSHPDSDAPEHVKDYVRWIVTEECGAEHVADIDWDHCMVVDD